MISRNTTHETIDIYYKSNDQRIGTLKNVLIDWDNKSVHLDWEQTKYLMKKTEYLYRDTLRSSIYGKITFPDTYETYYFTWFYLG